MSLNKVQGKPSTSEAQKSSWTPCQSHNVNPNTSETKLTVGKETPLGRQEDDLQTGL